MKRRAAFSTVFVVVTLAMAASGCAPRAGTAPEAEGCAAVESERARVGNAKPQAWTEDAKPQAWTGGAKPQALAEAHGAKPQAWEEDAKPQADSAFVSPFPGVRVRVSPPAVEIEAVRCLDVGWLEQVACAPNTREHESLVVVEAKPSHIHAALLMAGFEPGRPGQWIYHDEEQRIEVRPPSGEALRIMMRFERDGEMIEVPVGAWIRDHLGEQEFADEAWVFAGSMFAENPEFMGPGEHYVADQTGSIIGLVTFGDELIAFSKVIADQVDVQPAAWEVDDESAPPVGAKVTIVVTAWE